jgi:hypothetical protein
MKNSHPGIEPRSRLAAVARGVTHAVILAALGLTLGLTGLNPPAVTAQSVQEQQVPVDVQLHVGETASLEGGALQVTMLQVSEDSRCPMDVLCVWMGRAVVSLHVLIDGVDRGDVNVTLYPGPRTQRAPDLDATVDRYAISLADLQPYPVAGRPEPLDQRIATLRVAATTP